MNCLTEQSNQNLQKHNADLPLNYFPLFILTPPFLFPLFLHSQTKPNSLSSYYNSPSLNTFPSITSQACNHSSSLSSVFFASTLPISFAGLLAEPVIVPAFPVQIQTPTCYLDLSKELFGGVNDACGKNLDRSRCCPVLASWLFAAHVRSALEVPAPASGGDLLPMMPDDSQKCVNSLASCNVRIPQPNATCDTCLCFCGIRLHQITSLSCPAAFNVTGAHNGNSTGAHMATPTRRFLLQPPPEQ